MRHVMSWYDSRGAATRDENHKNTARTRYRTFKTLPLSKTTAFKHSPFQKLHARTLERTNAYTRTYMYNYNTYVHVHLYNQHAIVFKTDFTRNIVRVGKSPFTELWNMLFFLSFCSFIHDSQPHEERRRYTSHGGIISCCGADEVSQLTDSECRL